MKKIILSITAIILLLLIAAIALPFVIDVNHFRPEIENQFGAALGRQVHIVHLDLSILQGDLKATDISISDDPTFGTAPFVTANSLAIGIEVKPLVFSRKLMVRSVALFGPHITLLRGDSGQWNFSSLKSSDAAAGTAQKNSPATSSGISEFTVQKLQIVNGSLTLGMGPHLRQNYEKVNLTAENISYNATIPFRFEAATPGGGSLETTGIIGPFDQKDLALSPLEATVKLKKIDLVSTGLLEASSGIGGIINYEGKLKSNGKVARSDGDVTIVGLHVVQGAAPVDQPVMVQYSSLYDLVNQDGKLINGQIRTRSSAIVLAGTFQLHSVPAEIHMKVSSPKIPVEDIQQLLPAFGVTLPKGASFQGGEARTNLSIDGPVDRLVTNGNVSLSNTKLSGFGLSSQMQTISMLAGLKPSKDTLIQTFASNIQISPQGIRADDLQLVAPDVGTITGSGTVGQNGSLNFTLLATLSQNSVGGMLSKLAASTGIGGAIAKGVPFLVQGTTSSPKFLPDTKRIIQNIAPKPGTPSADTPKTTLKDVLGGFFGKKKAQ